MAAHIGRLGLIAALALLIACGRGPSRPPLGDPRPLNPAEHRAIGIPRPFGDTDPHEWTRLKPNDYAVHGIDASRYQGEIDFAKARDAGIRFAWLKATEGGDHLDVGYETNVARARAAGVPVGAYHFYYFCRTAAEQARWFIKNVPPVAGDLPPVLDMEWNHQSRTCRTHPEPDIVRADIRDFVRILRDHYGTTPVIYTTPDFYEDNDLGQLLGYEFWLRSVADHPSVRYPNARWAFWQYTGTGVVPGIDGIVDINAFAGDAANWDAWRTIRAQP